MVHRVVARPVKPVLSCAGGMVVTSGCPGLAGLQRGPSLHAMTTRCGGAAITLILVLTGIAGIAGLAWWAMSGGARPVAVPPLTTPVLESVPDAHDEAGLRRLLTQSAVVARGQVVFNGLCFTCHGPHGEGGLGPNLRDASWLHGSQMVDLIHVINDGTPGTAMQPMRYTYSAADIAAVTAYVVTLTGGTGGTDKAAEGEHRPITYWP